MQAIVSNHKIRSHLSPERIPLVRRLVYRRLWGLRNTHIHVVSMDHIVGCLDCAS